eukprot:5346723-Pyramimonas_sp.AAC.1
MLVVVHGDLDLAEQPPTILNVGSSMRDGAPTRQAVARGQEWRRGRATGWARLFCAMVAVEGVISRSIARRRTRCRISTAPLSACLAGPLSRVLSPAVSRDSL